MNQASISAQMKKTLALMLVAIVLWTVFPSVSLASARYVVKASSLQVRSSPSTKAAKLTTLKKGTSVTVLGSKGSWCKVRVNGKTGYVAKTYLTKKGNTASSSSSSSRSGYKPLSKGSSGTAVKKLQSRLSKLGYLSQSQVTGKYTNDTVKAVKYFQMETGAALTGKATAAMQKKLFSSSAPKKREIVKMNWFKTNINSLFPRRSTAYIIDCGTGKRIKIRRVYGTNHADVEPATASDTAKLKSIYRGSWSWGTRPVILVIKGRYVAASINGMPHGDEISTTNNFDGQFCLHTTGSKTHATDNVNNNHQSKITIAYRFLR